MHRALGKGLEALIPAVERKRESQDSAVTKIPIDRVKPNKSQPRTHFSDEKINELAESIKKHGLAQPILVSPQNEQGEYELIAGERRLRACGKAGLGEVSAIIRRVDDKERFQLSLVENLQREDLNPIEEARAFNEMIGRYKLTQQEIADLLALSRPSVANSIRLLSLPEHVQGYIASGQISSGQARALLGIDDDKLKEDLVRRIIQEKLTTREIEKIAGDWRQAIQSNRVRPIRKKDPELRALEETLQRIFGTRVMIKKARKGGWIKVAFYSTDDLERIMHLLESKKKKK